MPRIFGNGKANSGDGKASKTQAATRKDQITPALQSLAVPLASLTPDPHNARLHPVRNLKAIKDSLTAFGQVKPIVVRKDTRVIVAGNGTHRAAKELGWTHIAATFVDLSDVAAAAYGIADNRSAELAKWDHQAVAIVDQLLQEQRERGSGANLIGFSPDEIAAIRVCEGFAPEERQAVSKPGSNRSGSSEEARETIAESYGILITCKSDQEQRRLLDRLLKEGLSCRALTL